MLDLEVVSAALRGMDGFWNPGGTFEEERKLCLAYLPKPSGQAQGGQGPPLNVLLLTSLGALWLTSTH